MLHMNFQPFPVIETRNLNLVMLDDVHAEKILEIKRNKYLRPQRLKTAQLKLVQIYAQIMSNRDELKYNRSISWAVQKKGEGTCIGTIGYKQVDREHRRAELIFLFEKTDSIAPLAQEAMRAALAYGFDVIGLHGVQIFFDPKDPECRELALANGFTLDATLRDYFFDGAQFLDSEIFSILREEWLARNGK